MNRERIKDDLQDEFDVIAISDECKTVFLIEAKSTPKIDYIDDFRNDKIEREASKEHNQLSYQAQDIRNGF